MKKTIIFIFLTIIYLPLCLKCASKVCDVPCDVELKGYTSVKKRPDVNKNNILDGSFQADFTSWLESNLKPRGVLVRTYSTINYNLFGVGNRVIGKNDDIFEPAYINTTLSIGETYDFTKAENQERMQEFVDTIVSVQKKLEKFDKNVYVYVAASKSDFHYENIPDKYLNLAPEERVTSVDYLQTLLRETEIPHYFTKKMKDSLEYPAFYSTGIHWSKTYEQLVTNKVISDIADVTEKRYRAIKLSEVQSSKEPYWRDSDVYDLLNVWEKPDVTYFKYKAEAEYPDSYDKMRFLVYGDSFAQGFRADIAETYPTEDVIYVNYNNWLADLEGHYTQLGQSWDNFDFQYYVDAADVIVIEMVEPCIVEYTRGFVDLLDDFLDTYEPQSNTDNAFEVLDIAEGQEYDLSKIKGADERAEDYLWSKKYSEVKIKNSSKVEKGLEILIEVPNEIIQKEDKQDFWVYVNGKLLVREETTESGELLWLIEADDLPETVDDVYSVEIFSEQAFVPVDDKTELSFKIKYIGGKR